MTRQKNTENFHVFSGKFIIAADDLFGKNDPCFTGMRWAVNYRYSSPCNYLISLEIVIS